MKKEQTGIKPEIDADSFTGMHLSETGNAEEFIQRLKSEIVELDTVQKTKYLHKVIWRVNKESASHNTICSLEDCPVKIYFRDCLLKLEVLCELRRLN
jgi:hypothetical protein